jgi:hypothetical protein
MSFRIGGKHGNTGAGSSNAHFAGNEIVTSLFGGFKAKMP